MAMWELIKEDIHNYWKAAVFLLVATVILIVCFGGACISRIVVGLPCPACGMTRAALLFLSGHWIESIKMQPFFVIFAVGVVMCAGKRYIFRKKVGRWIRTYIWIMLVAAILFYIYRMVRYFPHTPPMTYNKDNLVFYMYYYICKIGKAVV